MYIGKQKNGASILFGVMFVLYFLLSAIRLDAFRINPELLLCLCCVCPVFCNARVSAVYGLVFGFLTDISITPPAHLSPVIFVLCALALPKLLSFFSRINVGVCAVCAIPLLLVRFVAGLVYLMSLHEGVSASVLIKTTLFPELMLNLACVIVTYFVCVGLARFFKVK